MDTQMEIAENREALEEAVVVMDENSENNGMEIAENQQALEAAKEEVEKIWRNAFKVEAYESIKADDLYKEIVEAIKKKERNEKFTREQKKEYNWSTRYERKLLNKKFELLKDGKIVVKESKLFDILYSNHIELGHAGRDNVQQVERKIFSNFKRSDYCVSQMLSKVSIKAWKSKKKCNSFADIIRTS